MGKIPDYINENDIRVIGTTIDMDKTMIKNLDDIKEKDTIIWGKNEDNPDYKLVVNLITAVKIAIFTPLFRN